MCMVLIRRELEGTVLFRSPTETVTGRYRRLFRLFFFGLWTVCW